MPFDGREAWQVARGAVDHFFSDSGWAMASHVALSSLMSLFPFVIFIAALAGFIGQDALAAQAAELMFSIWPEEVAGPIAAEVDRVVEGAGGGLLTVSAVIAFYLASNGVEAARTALNRAYRVVDRRSILLLRAQSLLFVLAGAIIALLLALAAVAAASAIGAVAEAAPWLPPLRRALTGFGVAGAAVMIVGGLVAAHLWLPAGRPQWRRLWPGIALTLGLWLLATWGFSIYVRSIANTAATYAGLAGVATAIFFLYIVAVALIFGAEFNAALNRLRPSGTGSVLR